ncbi:MAG: DUF3943 domain-containing protein [Myxococcota bacterium]
MTSTCALLAVTAKCLAVSALGPADADLVDLPPSDVEELRLWPAALETGGILALEVLWYEWQIELNKKDFDFARTWAGQRHRYERLYGLRFDNNTFGINMGHAYYNGSFYYDVARVLGGSFLESWLFTLAVSTLWEMTIEHREVLSLNDTLVTPVGGAAIGEAFYQLGLLFARGSPTVLNRVLTTLLSPAQTVNDLAGLTHVTRTSDVDRFGLPSDVRHELVLGVGYASSTRGSSQHDATSEMELRLDTELWNVSEYGHAGSVSRSLPAGALSRVSVLYALQRDELHDLRVFTEASVWGHYWQALGEGDDALRGYALFAGVATAFDMSIARLPDVTDFLGTMHVVGPSVAATWLAGSLRVDARLAGYVDFAMVRSMAIDELEATEVVGNTKSVLADERYTYALGVTGLARLGARWRRVGVEVSWEQNGYDSVEGRDRYQQGSTSPTGYVHQGVVEDFNVREERRMWAGTLSLQLAHNVAVRASAEDWMRRGSAKDVVALRRDRRGGVSLLGVF